MENRIYLVGDINLRKDGEFDEHCLDDIANVLAEADVRLGNLEGCLADTEARVPSKPTWLHPQPEMVTCLKGNFDAVSCANNVQFGDEPILRSLQVLDDNGIAHTGAGPDTAAAYRPIVVGETGAQVGMLAFTSVFQASGHAATETRPGVATIKAYTAYQPPPMALNAPGAVPIIKTWADTGELRRACDAVGALRSEVEVVVVYMHFGAKDSPLVYEYQTEIAHALVAAGADVVAGAHSHVLAGIEVVGSSLVFYGLGNFAYTPGFRADMPADGLLVKLNVTNGKLSGCTLVPTSRGLRGRTQALTPASEKGARLLRAVQAESGQFGTKFDTVENGVVLRL